MAIDWDKAVLGPLERVFGEGGQGDARVMFYPNGGESYPIDGVFDKAYKDVDLSDPIVPFNVTVPVLGVRLSLFAEQPLADDQVYIPSAKAMFLIKEVRPDGHGWAKLMLGEME